MATGKDEIFARVEAVISNEWVKNSHKDLMEVLAEIENLGVDAIRFQRGNHIVVGSLDQLVRVRDHFVGRENIFLKRSKDEMLYQERNMKGWEMKNESSKYVNELWQNEGQQNARVGSQPGNLIKNKPGSGAQDMEHFQKSYGRKAHNEPENEPTYCDRAGNHEIPKELMVDNDIWEYIESKRSEDLKELEKTFAATITRFEDDSGVLKISAKPNTDETAADVVDIMHESLLSLYQETFIRCVIEKHEVELSDETGQLVLGYISSQFPDVLAKKCPYNDDYLFIGPLNAAREARKQFQIVSARVLLELLKTSVPLKTDRDASMPDDEYMNGFYDSGNNESREVDESGFSRHDKDDLKCFNEGANWNKETYPLESWKNVEESGDEVDRKAEHGGAKPKHMLPASKSKEVKPLHSKEDNDSWNEGLTEKEMENVPAHGKNDTEFSSELLEGAEGMLHGESKLEFKKGKTMLKDREETSKSLEDVSRSGVSSKAHLVKINANSIACSSLDAEINQMTKKKKVPTATLR